MVIAGSLVEMVESRRRSVADRKAEKELANLCSLGDQKGVKLALGKNPDLARGWQSIHAAARHGQPKIVRELLACGADPNVRGGVERNRPLHRAIKRPKSLKRTPGHHEVVRVLIEAGADLNARGAWYEAHALATAAMSGEHEFVTELAPLYRKMDIFTACVTARTRRVRNLLESDTGLANARDPGNDMPPLHYCAASSLGRDDPRTSDHLRMIATMLIDAGADIDATMHLAHEFHALSWATMKKNRAAGDVICAAGAHPQHGLTYAVGVQDADLMARMKDSGADVDFVDEKGNSLLHTSINFGTNDEITFLVEHGADPNFRNAEGRTSLHLAASKGASIRIVSALRDHGANLDLKTAAGETPLDLAVSRGRRKVADYLADTGRDSG